MITPPRVALVADFDPGFAPHQATEEAVRHASARLNVEFQPAWIETCELELHASARLKEFAAVWIAPGSPYRSQAGALAAIRFARERDVPLLGTCGGFQHVVIEYARNVLGLADAAHAEYDPGASRLFISRLACSLAGKTMGVRLVDGSVAARAYGRLTAREEYYCNFGINPAVTGELFSRDLAISGADQDGEPRIIELPRRKFFVATLFVPQMQSRPQASHPLVVAWLRAASGG
jgi:CTP synthase (UTP-ammonia lyase)